MTCAPAAAYKAAAPPARHTKSAACALMISMEASGLGIAQNLDGTLWIVYRNVSIMVNGRLGRGCRLVH